MKNKNKRHRYNYCSYCGRKIKELPFKCKYCHKTYCSKHRLPEYHKCKELEKYNEGAKERWKHAIKSEFKSQIAHTHKTHEYKISTKNKIRKFWWKNKSLIKTIILIFLILLVFYYGARYYGNNKNSFNNYFNNSLEKIIEKYDDVVTSNPKEDKLHWRNMPVTFNFVEQNLYSNIKCQDHQIKRVKQAFIEIESETRGVVLFKEIASGGDIEIYCYGSTGEGGYMTSGEGGYEAYGNEITRGTLNFYTHRNCGVWPDVEIHEILHVFGYGHINDEWSIMNPIASHCDLGKIDEEIINDLIETYS